MIALCGVLIIRGAEGLRLPETDAALRTLRHRGPDHSASRQLLGEGTLLAHTRLKILDLADNANQPMSSPDGRWIISYNGEVVNFRALRAEIGDRWHWKTSSDTEVILAAWSVWGAASLHRFVGMFAFAVVDTRERQLHLVRDRFGIKPLYVAHTHDQTVAASEIPAILELLPSVQPNLSTIRTYLELGLYDHCEATFFTGIQRVMPGSIWSLDLETGETTTETWYRISDHLVDLHTSDSAELIAETARLASQAVLSHEVADVPLGMNVSGGVDSAMLVAAGSSGPLQEVPLLHLEFPGYSERDSAARLNGTRRLSVVKVTERDVLNLLRETVRQQAEPFGGVFIVAYNLLYRMARQIGVKVLLDGNGVDETFLGYSKYLANNPRPTMSIDGTDATSRTWIGNALTREELLPSEVPEISGERARDLALWDLTAGKIPRALRFTDRVSMAHSCELRVPFLDHRLVEFGCSIPTSRLLSAKGTKLVWRDAVHSATKSNEAFAPKKSVQTPQREWIHGLMRPLITQVLESDSFRDRQWVDAKRAREYFEDFEATPSSNSFPIWQWLNLELWAQTFFDGEP